MKQLAVMIKPASSLCNMKCKYCFYEDISNLRTVHSHGIMHQETVELMLLNIKNELDKGDNVTLAFQGGEPMLAGLEFFENFVDQVKNWEKDINVSYAIQTNGTKIDETWAKFFYDNNFLVGVSLDLLQDLHDDTRIDNENKGTWKKTINAIRILEEYKVEYNVLCTLTNGLARYPKKVWNTIEKLDLKYVQFTPCLNDLEFTKKNIYALTPERFSSFYKEIFTYWFSDMKQGKYRSIKLFDDIVNLLALGITTACGMNGACQPQLVVEADGSVYPCDFYCLDEYCLGNITNTSLKDLYEFSFNSNSKKREALPKLCSTCEYLKFCGGNCKRMQKEICCMPEDNFCGYKDFLESSIKDFILLINSRMNSKQVDITIE